MRLVVLFLVPFALMAQDPTRLGPRTYDGLQDQSGATLKLPSVTYANLPSAASASGQVFIVTDSPSPGDCGSGGGTSRNLCYSNGTSWTALGDAVGASAYSGTNEIVIGKDATGGGANTATLGNASITKTILRGQVLLGSEGVWASGSEGTCDSQNRGRVVMTFGSAGNADTFRICTKDSSDSYSWAGLPNTAKWQFHSKIWGTGTNSVLTDTDDELSIWRNELSARTITKVTCESDAGSPTIMLQKDDGTPVDMWTTALTCSTSGATQTSFNSGENSLSVGDRIDLLIVAAGGVAKWVAVTVSGVEQ